jgi:RNA polymerase sigma-70 factor (ECF subfamily)
VQETFLRAYRHLGSYREQDRFRPWLWRILINRCRTLAAERARRPPRHDATVLEQLAAPGGPEADLDRHALRQALATALQALPTEQREAVLLHHAEGLSYPAISALTGAGVSALKMRVTRACLRLRELLDSSHVQASTDTSSELSMTQSDPHA